MRKILVFSILAVSGSIALVAISPVSFARTVTLTYVLNPNNPKPCHIPSMENVSLTFDISNVRTSDRGLPFYLKDSKTEITPPPLFESEKTLSICGYFSDVGGIITIGNKKYPLRWMSIWTSLTATGFKSCNPNDFKESLRISGFGRTYGEGDCFIALAQKQ